MRAAAFGTRVIATTLDPPKLPPKPLAWSSSVRTKRQSSYRPIALSLIPWSIAPFTVGDDSDNPRLFAESDFLVICVPLLNSTRGLVDGTLLSHLPPVRPRPISLICRPLPASFLTAAHCVPFFLLPRAGRFEH